MKSVYWFILFLSLPVLVGFDFTKHSIPTSEILSGGPPKDGIPAIMEPKFIPADQASFLNKNDRVLGLMINGEAKPIRLKS
jgi:hypothetical protein